jgi:hypothetical protein
MKTIILTLALCSALTACNAVPDKEISPEPDGFSQSYEESIKPANGIKVTTLEDWKKIDTRMQAMVPSKAALFSEVLFLNDVHSVGPDDKRQAGMVLNQVGKNFLAGLEAKCWVFNATQSKTSVDNNRSELIRGALGLSGDNCLLVISDNQETKRTVTSRSTDIENFSTSSQQIAKIEVKDAAIAAASGFSSSTSTLNINGNFVRYPKTSFKFASGKIILNGTFSVVLAGETISGTITGEAHLGSAATAQFLLEGNSSQGAIRLITKRSNRVNQYFFNGTEVSGAVIPSFLTVVDDYLK